MLFHARFVWLSALVAPLALLACSGDDDAGNPASGGAANLTAFEGYCTGTLLKDKELMVPWAAGGWQSSDDLVAPAGSVFLLAESFDKWEGYVILNDGSPTQIDADFSTGLVAGSDFNTDCVADPTTVSSHMVLLRDTSFYASEALSGDACVIPAGTHFESYSFYGGGEVADFSSDALQEPCGFTEGHSSDITYASLVPRPTPSED